MKSSAPHDTWKFPSDYVPRVILKLRRDSGPPLPTTNLLEQELEHRGIPINEIRSQFPGIGPAGRLYVESQAELKALATKVRDRFGAAPEYETYISFLSLHDAEQVVALIRERSGVALELAFVESPPAPPPGPTMPGWPYVGQIYLQPAPGGVDALSMWDRDAVGNINGDTGKGVTIFHLDESWDLTHPELPVNIPLTGYNHPGETHGTRVLGMLAAQDRSSGCRGIAYDATFQAISLWSLDPQGVHHFSRAGAIRVARKAASAGDVILIESQSPDNTPVEVEKLVYDEIQAATAMGICVIEPVGNPVAGNSVNVDKKLKLPDSGATLVAGAASGPKGWTPIGSTGTRIHCFASGTEVVTIDPDDPVGTSTMSLTSGASAIVAGAAALVQSWSKRLTGAPLDPADLRTVLSDPALNTLPAAGAAIGVMPDLARIHAYLLAEIV